VADPFAHRFGHAPDHIVTTPGRVNLIGDHTDYALLPVLPMAIDRSIRVAASRAADTVIHSTAFDDEYDGTGSPVGWQRYAVAAQQASGVRYGVHVMIDGDLPSTGGLSSSTAVTLGVLAAVGKVFDLQLEPDRLAQLSIAAERSLGVEGGLMDQLVIVHGRRGSALRIDFDPIRFRDVPIPETLRFVVAYSGTPGAKAAAARDGYNTRVVAARAAAACLASVLERSVGEPPTLSEVADVATKELVAALPSRASLADLMVSHRIDPGPVATLAVDTYDLLRPLPVLAAAAHILSESARVRATEAALVEGDASRVGALMDQSHSSLRAFGVSSPGLEDVTQAMRDAGAHGARITGAGFGGNAVAACPADRVEAVIAAAVAATGGPAFEVVASDGLS
jgi:galactokinase